ncbi:MAG: hypothetical protein IJZ04_04265, partial [Clostridia bacterium]|nr:hypothetical protein [Clostridia bacterium]
RKRDFIHQRWISPVEDGFDCVFSVKENTLIATVSFYSSTCPSGIYHIALATYRKSREGFISMRVLR